jgi:uncharacterized sulfatase
MGHNGIWHKGNGRWILVNNRGDRPNLYDNSLRVPAIIRWPKAIPAGRVIEQTASHLDWFPTIVESTGSQQDEEIIRGRSLLPILQGKKVDWDNDVFAQYSMWEWNQTGAKLRAFRSSGWKMVRDFAATVEDELYHLERDPEETTNLIHSNNPAATKMKKNLEDTMLSKMENLGDRPLNTSR